MALEACIATAGNVVSTVFFSEFLDIKEAIKETPMQIVTISEIKLNNNCVLILLKPDFLKPNLFKFIPPLIYLLKNNITIYIISLNN